VPPLFLPDGGNEFDRAEESTLIEPVIFRYLAVDPDPFFEISYENSVRNNRETSGSAEFQGGYVSKRHLLPDIRSIYL
jgi:hypothetical protein